MKTRFDGLVLIFAIAVAMAHGCGEVAPEAIGECIEAPRATTCRTDADCDDGSPCTTEECVFGGDGLCVYTPVADVPATSCGCSMACVAGACCQEDNS